MTARHLSIRTLFGQTLRSAPSDADTDGHRLLLRAAFVRQLASGIYSALPLGWRSLKKIERIIREEMDAIGGQEMSMPVVHPAEVWQRTGRWYAVGPEMVRFHDRAGRDMVLGMTHEEIVGELASREILSWRQLPQIVYQIQTKFRDEPRARAGLIRVREFVMKDAYSFDRDLAGLQAAYEAHHHAYTRIFERAGLKSVLAVQSDTGMMGGKIAHEFMYPSPIGEDTLVRCTSCGYASNQQIAQFQKKIVDNGPPKTLERVATPGTTTIDALATYLGIKSEQTAKAVFFAATVAGNGDAPLERLLMAMVRGDHDVNETKLVNATGATDLRPATRDEILDAGAEPGFASPIGVDRTKTFVVIDDLVASTTNLVSGANETDVHLRNVNAGRDYEPDAVADIATATEGSPCSNCGQPLESFRGVEVGNIFQLGTRYSEALGAHFTDEDGHQQPLIMGSYGIGVGRLLACLAEEFHDDKGLTLPRQVAPFDVHVVTLGDDVAADTAGVLAALEGADIECALDDRKVSPGVKFADAELIGAPLRITISPRSLAAGGVELQARTADTKSIVPAADVVGAANHVLGQV